MKNLYQSDFLERLKKRQKSWTDWQTFFLFLIGVFGLINLFLPDPTSAQPTQPSSTGNPSPLGTAPAQATSPASPQIPSKNIAVGAKTPPQTSAEKIQHPASIKTEEKQKKRKLKKKKGKKSPASYRKSDVTEPPPPTERLSPRIKITVDPEATQKTSLSSSVISAFLNDHVTYQVPPSNVKISGSRERKVLLGPGDFVFLDRLPEEGGEGSFWKIYGAPTPIRHHRTRQTMAYMSQLAGMGKLVETNPPILQITDTAREIHVGNFLSPVIPQDLVEFSRSAPDSEMKGEIIAFGIDQGISFLGPMDVAIIDIGSRDKLKVGEILSIYGSNVMDSPEDRYSEREKDLPISRQTRVGEILVFQVFENFSNGLILDASEPLAKGYVVANIKD